MNAGRLVSKQELDDAVWPNVAVTDASLAQCIRELRDKLGDTSRTLIKTVHRRGYMLDTVVTEEAAEAASQTVRIAPAAADDGHSRPDAETADVTQRPTMIAGATASGAAPAQGSGAQRKTSRRWALVWSAAAAATVAAIILSTTTWLPELAMLPGESAKPPTMFRDCGECPEMVVLPAAGFGKETADNGKQAGAPKTIAVGRFEITVEQFAAFVDQSRHEAGTSCNIVTVSGRDVNLQTPATGSFREQPNKQLTGKHPASCVSWYDAKAYVAWLAGKTGKPYRLLTNAEWEYAARAGTTGPYSFEGGVSRLCEYARFADLDSQFPWASGCHSGTAERGALPVGSLKPNPWGLFDMHGNVWELVDDCSSSDPAVIAATDVNSLAGDGCKVGVIRGGGWAAASRRVDVGVRIDVLTRGRGQSIGFRVGLTIDP